MLSFCQRAASEFCKLNRAGFLLLSVSLIYFIQISTAINTHIEIVNHWQFPEFRQTLRPPIWAPSILAPKANIYQLYIGLYRGPYLAPSDCVV